MTTLYDECVALGYRPWTVKAWIDRGVVPAIGCKLGPLTVNLWWVRAERRPECSVCWLCAVVIDTYLSRMRRGIEADLAAVHRSLAEFTRVMDADK